MHTVSPGEETRLGNNRVGDLQRFSLKDNTDNALSFLMKHYLGRNDRRTTKAQSSARK